MDQKNDLKMTREAVWVILCYFIFLKATTNSSVNLSAHFHKLLIVFLRGYFHVHIFEGLAGE